MTEPALKENEPLDQEACWELLKRVAASTPLKRATRLQKLLLYVGQCSLKDGRDQVREQEIGTKVFGRPESYDTSIDNIVRTNVSDLRKRIGAYFNGEGQHEPVTMEIPRGSYLPVFTRRREEAASIAEPTEAVHVPEAEETLAPAVRQWGRWVAAVAITEAVVIVALTVGCLVLWNQRHSHERQLFAWSNSPELAGLWNPILREKGDVLMCAGGNVFSWKAIYGGKGAGRGTNYPGLIAAGKEIEYPYFSNTTVSSVAMLSSLIERAGGTPRFALAATTPLPRFQEHPIILLNAYNNQWTMRLAEPLRFHFAPDIAESEQSIVDRTRPGFSWKRDPNVPYSSADDYALVARFWDPTVDNWVLILAGIGRNGSEAAAEFVTNPQYLQMLRKQAGTDFTNRNIEAVLKLSVIEGKTGAPTIVAVHVW